MVRVAKQTDPVKLEALKVQINDRQYLQVAIERIARRLTEEIVNRTGERKNYKL